MIHLIIQHSLIRAGDEQALLGARDADIAQAALLLHLRLVHEAARGRENALFQTGHEHIGEFQALGGVQRHQRHIAALVLLLVKVSHQ